MTDNMERVNIPMKKLGNYSIWSCRTSWFSINSTFCHSTPRMPIHAFHVSTKSEETIITVSPLHLVGSTPMDAAVGVV